MSRQDVKVEHKVSSAVFTSIDENWVGEGKRMTQQMSGRREKWSTGSMKPSERLVEHKKEGVN